MLSTFNFRVIANYLPLFLQGFWATLWISALAMAGALAIGVLVCTCRISKFRSLSAPAKAYIEVIRSTPLLAQLYFFYFGLPSLGIRLTEHHTGIIVLSLNSGAYIGELIRAGILSVHTGQVEAGVAFGLNFFQRMWYIILPQALRTILPALVGQYVLLIKDSSIVSIIGLTDVTRVGWLTVQRVPEGLMVFGLVGILYFCVCYPLIQLSGWFERRLSIPGHDPAGGIRP